jgi:HK97 family phage major capsid protein
MSEIVKSLLDARQADWARAKELLTRAQEDKRELTSEENAEFDKLMGAMSDKDAKAQAVAGAEERAVKVDALRAQYEVAAAPAAEKSEDAKTLRAILTGDKRSADFEMRALAKGTATVPVTFADFVVTYLTETAPVYAVARKLRTTAGEDITVPRLTANQAANWVGEAAQISPTDPTLDSITLKAHKLATLTLISSELAADNAVNIEQLVGEAAGRAIGQTAGSAFTVGTGTVVPNGFITAAGSVTASGSAAFFDATDIFDLIYGLKAPYRNQDTVIMASPTAVAKIRKFQSTDGQFIYAPGLDGAGSDRLAGFRFLENHAMAAVGSASKSVAILHAPSYIVREAGSLSVARSTDFKFDYDQMAIRVTYRVDGNLLDANAALYLKSKNS